MRFVARAALAASMLAMVPLNAWADPLTYAQMKTMIEGMGYTPKEIGQSSPKLEIALVTPQFNVPAGIEITPSGRFIWITANLGESKIDGEGALRLLKRSSEWQPTQFWITKANTLTVGIAINNLDVNAETLKFVFEKLGADVGKSADIWQGPAQSAQ